MRTLYLLRHGKAEAGAPGGDDFERALTTRGERDAARMGAHLAGAAELPDFYVCSTALRARQTLDAVRNQLPALKRGQCYDDLYLAAPSRILERVHEVDDAHAAVLVVGHNPGLAQLAEVLTRPAAKAPHALKLPKFPTAALAALRFEVDAWCDLMPGRGMLEFTSPKLLDATR